VNDDGFEWFGGTVNAKYLISYRNVDDDFDTDFGYRGKVQFGVAMRDSSLYDIGSGPTTNGFESDNDGSGTGATPNTEATFSNMTIVGPLKNGKALDYTNSFQNGARIRRNSAMSLFNSIIMGFPTGIFIDGTASANKLMNDTLLIKNNIVAGFTLKAINAPSALLTDVKSKLLGNGNDTVVSASNILMDAFNYTNPNWTVKAGGMASTGASFTGNKISDAFFTSTTYRGAFGEENWTSGWANFDPQNTDYSKPLETGIKNDDVAISTINVFPNPAANELNVQITMANAAKVNMCIYSIDGKLLNVLPTQQFNTGNNNFKVDVKDLNNGLYILKINSNYGQQNVRFCVVK
jgi:hypothetical protein